MSEFKKIKFPGGSTLKEFENHCIKIAKIIRSASFKLEDFKIK